VVNTLGIAVIIKLGNGDNDVVNSGDASAIRVGNGAGDVVNSGDASTIRVGNGNNDVVNSGGASTIRVGNGNDTIHVGALDAVTVGTGQDNFVFDQTVPSTIGAATINGFDPSKDVIVMQQTLASTFSVQDDVHGNAVITFAGDNSDAITLMGVHASALHSSDFHLV
jgi:Ca2+-binding RTX toxin-like protein